MPAQLVLHLTLYSSNPLEGEGEVKGEGEGEVKGEGEGGRDCQWDLNPHSQQMLSTGTSPDSFRQGERLELTWEG